MATATAQTRIESAFRKLGIKTAGAGRLANGLEALNNMLGNDSAGGLIVPNMVTENFTLVVGTSIYTIGSSGDFNTVRPIRIVSGYVKDSDGHDHGVDTNMSLQEYNDIDVKTSNERPNRLYYDTIYPLAKIHFDSEPVAAEEFYLDSWKPLTELAALGTTVSLPDEYKRYIDYNLALELAPEERIMAETIPLVVKIARDSKSIIKALNVHPQNKVEIDSILFQAESRQYTYDINVG